MRDDRHSNFVFKEKKDGSLKFIGDFDGLYSSFEDPWGQSGAVSYTDLTLPTKA